MSPILLILILILVFGVGGGGFGYYHGGPMWGGGILGTVLIVVLVLWLIGPGRQ